MADLTDAQRIAHLQAEIAALRKQLGGSQGPLHPDVQSSYFVGSVVIYKDQIYRVTGRSIDWDGFLAYTITPVDTAISGVVHVSPEKLVRKLPMDHPESRTALAGIRTYDVAYDAEGESVFDVAETELEPYHEHDTFAYAYAEAAAEARHGGHSDTGTMEEGSSVTRE